MCVMVSGLVCTGYLSECPGCEVAGQRLFCCACCASDEKKKKKNFTEFESEVSMATTEHRRACRAHVWIHVIIRTPSDSAKLL